DAVAPGVGLGVEVVEALEGASGEEAVADIADGALHTPLLVAPRHGHGTGLVPIVPGEGDQGGVEANGRAMALEHGALQVVIEQDPGESAQAWKASSWPDRNASIRASRKKRRKIRRERLKTMTKAMSGRRARPICRCPKWPQSTWACSPASVRSRR